MILLVTPSERAFECATALTESTGERVVVAENLAQATTLLRAECYLAVVLDQYVLEAEPYQAETMIEHIGTAIPVHLNLAISGVERLVREVRAAIRRRQRDEERARQAAVAKLRSELNSTVTALLLSSELGLETPGLPPAAAEKLGTVYQLVQKLRTQLESAVLLKNSESETESVQSLNF